MERRTVFFAGHRDIPEDRLEHVKRELRREAREAAADGYNWFITGLARGTDRLAAQAVLEVKKEYPDIHLEAAIPYRGQVKRLHREEGVEELLQGCSAVGVWAEKYHRDCFITRNFRILDEAARVVAVYNGQSEGGTAQTMRYARSIGKDVREIQI